MVSDGEDIAPVPKDLSGVESGRNLVQLDVMEQAKCNVGDIMEFYGTLVSGGNLWMWGVGRGENMELLFNGYIV